MTPHRIELVLAVTLLGAGAILIIAGLRRRPSRQEFTLARAAAMAAPVPVAESPPPNPPPPGRSSRRERRVARALLDRSAWAAVDAAASAVRAAAGEAWPYAMLVGPHTVTALLAGTPPPQPPAGWRQADRGWMIDRRLLATAADGGSMRACDTFVALGSRAGGMILLDLACAPGVITITGDHDAARDLMRSLVTQLQAVPRNRVLVAGGVLPPGAADTTAAGLLDHAAAVRDKDLPHPPRAGSARRPGHPAASRDGTEAAWTFLCCPAATPAEIAGLRAAAEGDGRMRVLVLGDVTGSRWSLLVGAGGGVIADGLGLAASSRPAVGLAASSRAVAGRDGGAFFDAELDATVERHPALAPVLERDPRLEDVP